MGRKKGMLSSVRAVLSSQEEQERLERQRRAAIQMSAQTLKHSSVIDKGAVVRQCPVSISGYHVAGKQRMVSGVRKSVCICCGAYF